MGSRYPLIDVKQNCSKPTESVLAAQLLISLAMEAMHKGHSERAIGYIDMAYVIFDDQLGRTSEERPLVKPLMTELSSGS